MIQERSAGAIVYRRDVFGTREYLLLNHGRHWDFPKGHTIPGETDRAAAERELCEETCIRAATFHEGFCREIRYVFRSRGVVVNKAVVFFVALTDVDAITLSHEHVGFAWMTYDIAMKAVTYPTSRDVLKRAEEFLARTSPQAG